MKMQLSFQFFNFFKRNPFKILHESSNIRVDENRDSDFKLS